LYDKLCIENDNLSKQNRSFKNIIMSNDSRKMPDKEEKEGTKYSELKELYNKLKEDNTSLSKENWKNKELINSKID
jgi:hypothetical protein